MNVRRLQQLLDTCDPDWTLQHAFDDLAARGYYANMEPVQHFASIDAPNPTKVLEKITKVRKVPQISSEHLSQLMAICATWAEDPQAYFGPWTLTTNTTDLPQPPVPKTIPPADTNKSLRQRLLHMRNLDAKSTECRIRYIFGAIFFFDAIKSQISRGMEGNGLPTGKMPDVVRRVWEKFTGEMPDDQIVADVSTYVTHGHSYHLLGEAVGQGLWILIPEEAQLIQRRYTKSKLQSKPDSLKPIRAFVQKRPITSKAAQFIRESQFTPFKAVSRARRPIDAQPQVRLLKRLKPSRSSTTMNPSMHYVCNQSQLSGVSVPQHQEPTQDAGEPNTSQPDVPDNGEPFSHVDFLDDPPRGIVAIRKSFPVTANQRGHVPPGDLNAASSQHSLTDTLASNSLVKNFASPIGPSLVATDDSLWLSAHVPRDSPNIVAAAMTCTDERNISLDPHSMISSQLPLNSSPRASGHHLIDFQGSSLDVCSTNILDIMAPFGEGGHAPAAPVYDFGVLGSFFG